MKRKPKKPTNNALWLDDQPLAEMRMRAVQVAAGLPEPQNQSYGMGGGYPGTPGKSASKVIAEAELIVAFVTKR